MPSMTDPLFKKSIVYLFEHDINGAAGVIINKGYSSLIFNSSFKQENF
jgi:putative transcriptional regulator